ncbi:MAG: glycosyltransferase [Chitinophagaceae bacterium]
MAAILTIVPYKIFPAKVGGQKGIALFNEYLAKETSLLCISVKDNDPGQAKGYTLMNILSGSPFRYINPLYIFIIRKIIKQQHITILLLEHPYYGWLGIMLKWLTGVQLAVHSHNIEALRWKTLGKWWWPVLWQYEKMVHRAANYNFFIQDDDRALAIRKFKLSPAACTTITYGIEWDTPPSTAERLRCRTALQHQHAIADTEAILLFNGTLDYPPNLSALKNILEKINPILMSTGFAYKIIICGRGLPAVMNELKDFIGKNIIYAGFADDITAYFKGADIFINPVIDGGGIKTKLVEALGYGTTSVSTINGSIGVTKEDAGELLRITDNDDWNEFSAEIIRAFQSAKTAVPASFYKKFYWGNIAKKAAAFIHL